MLDTTDDLYANSGDAIWLRVAMKYYRRDVGKGWFHVDPLSLPPLMWQKLAEQQRAVYVDQLPGAGE